MSTVVASRYAGALVDILLSPQAKIAPDAALTQLRTVRAMQSESNELRKVLASPAVGAAKKRAVIAQFAALVPLSPIIRNFLYVLIDHRRIAMLPEVISAVESQMDERTGVARAYITSARPLDESQQAAVQAALAKVTGKQVLGQYAVDESLIGGVVAKIGSRIYDGSVRGQLDSLRDRLVRS